MRAKLEIYRCTISNLQNAGFHEFIMNLGTYIFFYNYSL